MLKGKRRPRWTYCAALAGRHLTDLFHLPSFYLINSSCHQFWMSNLRGKKSESKRIVWYGVFFFFVLIFFAHLKDSLICYRGSVRNFCYHASVKQTQHRVVGNKQREKQQQKNLCLDSDGVSCVFRCNRLDQWVGDLTQSWTFSLRNVNDAIIDASACVFS